MQFAREGALADAGGVGFKDSQASVEQAGGHAGPGVNAQSAGAAAGDIGIGAVVHVQQGAVGPFVKDALAGAVGLVE